MTEPLYEMAARIAAERAAAKPPEEPPPVDIEAFLTDLQELQRRHGFYVHDCGIGDDHTLYLCSADEDELVDTLRVARR
jgi:hypothetical protein